MEEDEARLKALLDTTSDFDERKKIRADLRALRMKKLDAMNEASAAESNERAARRAERAKARKAADQTNGEVSSRPSRRTKEPDEEEKAVEVSDEALDKMDEEALQNLLNEVPSSQFEDRRKIRAKIREVKRRKTEDEPAVETTYSRRQKEVTTITDDGSGVTVETTTVETTVETRQEVADTTGGDDVGFQITIEASSQVNGEVDQFTDAITNELITDVQEVVEDQKDEEPVRVEVQVNGIDTNVEVQAPAEEVVPDEEPVKAVEETVPEEEPVRQEETKVESEPPAEAVNGDIAETNELQDENVALQVKTEGQVSLEIKLDQQMSVSSSEIAEEAKEEPKIEPEPTKEAPQEKDTAETTEPPSEDAGDGQPPPAKDTPSDKKPAGKVGSRWQPQAKDDKAGGKPGDFRAGLKKSGRIGGPMVNLEKKGSANGAQVDFRDSSLKKSGRLPTNLEKKPNTAGAQVDFRGANLKKSGVLGKGPVNLEKKGSTHGAQVDFRGGLKQTGGKAAVNVKLPFSAGKGKSGAPADTKADEAPVDTPAEPEPAKQEEPVKQEEAVKQEEEPVKQEEPAKPVETPKPKVEPPKPKYEPPKSKFPPVKQKVSPFGAKVGDKGASDVKKPAPGKGLLGNKFMKNKDVKPAPAPAKKPQAEPQQSSKKAEPAADAQVNGVAVELDKTAITESAAPGVQIEVTEHEETKGDTQTKVTEVKTTKAEGDVVEEKKEVSKVSKTTGPGGRLNYQRRDETTSTKKTFVDPEVKQRLALHQREKFQARKEQQSATKNKRMAFMQKLEANSPAQKGPSNVKRSGSNVDKLLSWCRFKTRDYEGVQLSNFSSSWADGLAFCALIHIYVPDKVPYEELLAGKDRRRNFEVAFSVATEAGVPELLEVDDMMMVTNPEPKSVMTYVSSIYKHFNPA